jgi:hypothetical protein
VVKCLSSIHQVLGSIPRMGGGEAWGGWLVLSPFSERKTEAQGGTKT